MAALLADEGAGGSAGGSGGGGGDAELAAFMQVARIRVSAQREEPEQLSDRAGGPASSISTNGTGACMR